MKAVCTKCQKFYPRQTTAMVCPDCGGMVLVNLEKSDMYVFAFIAVLLIFIAYSLISSANNKEPEKQVVKTQTEIRQDKIQAAFHPWDGSHIKLEKLIKESMKDPDSYEHVDTKAFDKGDYIIVKTTFRGKNAFGGVVATRVTANCSLDGDVIKITSQEAP